MKKLLFPLLLLCAFCSFAQDVTKNGRPWSYGTVALPSTPTGITALTVYVDYIYLTNTSGSAVTVTVVDQSTTCNNTACQIVPGVSLGANSIYAIPVLGAPAVGGIKWNASTANVVHGFIAGRY